MFSKFFRFKEFLIYYENFTKIKLEISFIKYLTITEIIEIKNFQLKVIK